MSRNPDTRTAPGPECCCGSELKPVPLPASLREVAGTQSIWVHVHNSDTRCYPESDNPEDAAATAEPAEG